MRPQHHRFGPPNPHGQVNPNSPHAFTFAGEGGSGTGAWPIMHKFDAPRGMPPPGNKASKIFQAPLDPAAYGGSPREFGGPGGGLSSAPGGDQRHSGVCVAPPLSLPVPLQGTSPAHSHHHFLERRSS
ncbi:unnamed protein product, partial [Discosporangium mesarthrocarpum]